MKYIVVVLLLLCVSCKSQTKTSINDKTTLPIIENFYKVLERGEVEKSLLGLLATNENIDLKDSIALELQKKFKYINESSGAYAGNRLLKKGSIGNDVIIYSYLTKYDRKFYRFIFMFYNNGKSIKLYKFLFDDNVDIELEESLKFYAN